MAFDLESMVGDQEAELIQAIQAEPTDNELRLVYADWLEDQGDSKCEYVRLDWELASGEGTGREEEILQRLEELRPDMDCEWLSLTARSAVETCIVGTGPWDVKKCPARWLRLTPTDLPSVRLCGECQRTVFFCRDLADARWHVNQQDLVAVDATVERSLHDLRLDPRVVGDPPAELEQLEARRVKVIRDYPPRRRPQRSWWDD